MTLHYVYLKWCSPTNPRSVDYNRYLLTCTSRYVADEFFRAMRAAKGPSGNPRYTMLRRETPQFWCYDSTSEVNAWDIAPDILRQRASEFNLRVMIGLLPGVDSATAWPIIPLVEGPDWVNGGTFFIRNKRQPNLYWAATTRPFANPDLIVSSGGARSKFRVRGVDLPAQDSETVLIRDDTVTVTLVGKRSQTAEFYVGRDPIRGSDCLVLSAVRATWKFGDFFSRFGVSEENGGPVLGSARLEASGDEGDEWEFC